jgi:uncharacterized cupin superfamily protein
VTEGADRAGPVGKTFDQPDETRTFDKGRVDVVTLGTHTAGRATFEPGWRWSECVKPIVGTESCQVHHLGYVLSGRLHIVMDSGEEVEAEPGLAYEVQPGRDAWVVGEEAFVALEFQPSAVETYAKPG